METAKVLEDETKLFICTFLQLTAITIIGVASMFFM